MQTAVLHKSIVLKDAQGRETRLEGFRFLSRHDVHRAGIRLVATALNYSDTLTVESIADGTVTNIVEDQGAPYEVKHLKLVENVRGYLEMATRDADVRIGVGTAVKAYNDTAEEIIVSPAFVAVGEQNRERLELSLTQGQPIRLDKFAITYTSRDVEPASLKSTVADALEQFIAAGLNQELDAHMQTYRRLWDVADVVIQGDPHAQKSLRFNILVLWESKGYTHI